jgi:hypothetical protein
VKLEGIWAANSDREEISIGEKGVTLRMLAIEFGEKSGEGEILVGIGRIYAVKRRREVWDRRVCRGWADLFVVHDCPFKENTI